MYVSQSNNCVVHSCVVMMSIYTGTDSVALSPDFRDLHTRSGFVINEAKKNLTTLKLWLIKHAPLSLGVAADMMFKINSSHLSDIVR